MAKRNIEKKSLKTWDGLVKTINHDFVYYPGYIFRGHAQSNWLLEPTLNRVLKRLKLPEKEDYTRFHLEFFKQQIRGKRGFNPRDLTEDELWALGQHHGLYTPLLDWTMSPYVALFFAFSETKKSTTGKRALWALHMVAVEEINDWYKSKKKDDKSVEIINLLLDENSRLVSQRGMFTKINPGTDIESWILDVNADTVNGLCLIKYEFPESIREEGMVHLNLMNINYASLFPDLFGSSMAANFDLENQELIIEKQNHKSPQFKKNK